MTRPTDTHDTAVHALLVGPLAGEPPGAQSGEAVPWPAPCPNPDLVFAVDGGFYACRTRRWRTDLVVGDFDSLAPGELIELQQRGVQVVRFDADKDYSDLDGALSEAVARGATHITVVGVMGGRLDHQLAVVGSLARVTAATVLSLGPTADAGQPADYDVVTMLHRGDVVEVAPERTFSVIAALGGASVSVGGARWPLEGATIEPLSSVGLSNRSLEDGARVECHDGVVAVIVPAK